jgi:hypothetical protein
MEMEKETIDWLMQMGAMVFLFLFCAFGLHGLVNGSFPWESDADKKEDKEKV